MFQHGTQDIRHLDRVKWCAELRGRPVLRSTGLTVAGGRELCRLCPTGAIEIGGDGLRLDLGRCLFCGECAVRYPNNVRFTNDYRLASTTREGLVVSEWEEAGVWKFDHSVVRPEIKRLFGRSLQLREVSAGGDNSCEMELGAAGNVNFDMGRFGFGFTASPRHADGVVVTGPVTANMARELEATWQAVPEPKVLIAVGTDAISGGLFAESPAVNRAFFEAHRPDLYVPGNPTHPMTFITGLRALVERVPVSVSEEEAEEGRGVPKVLPQERKTPQVRRRRGKKTDMTADTTE
ncbi:MAG: NADH:ubiquinone oxidoreductase [Rikenella sp.]|nr:NADH:ubiquinone oxidoreductase [Rikenella sp.]